jgi:hypothetical protein
MKRPCLALWARSAYHCSESSSVPRGEKTAVVVAFHGCGGAGLACSFAVRTGAFTGESAQSRSQYSRNACATAASSTMWPTLAWPKIPFSVRLVEPVQTALGTPFLLRTKNLLCISLPCTRPRQSALMCAAAIASCS